MATHGKGAQQPSFLCNAHVISSSAAINGKQIMSMHGGGGFAAILILFAAWWTKERTA